MKTKLTSLLMPAVLCAAAFLVSGSNAFGGTLAGFRTIDTGIGRINISSGSTATNAAVNRNDNTGARIGRHGADDPPNHDAGDDRGRHHRRGRGRG